MQALCFWSQLHVHLGVDRWVAQPDVAVALLTLGILLLYVEANRPGRVLPGCLGLFLVSISLSIGPALLHADKAELLGCTVMVGAVTAWLVRLALVARRNKFILGHAGMLHKRGLTWTALRPDGQIEIAGELWPAVCTEAIPAGRPIVVAAVRAGILEVRELAR